jgi:hypothetical protein
MKIGVKITARRPERTPPTLKAKASKDWLSARVISFFNNNFLSKNNPNLTMDSLSNVEFAKGGFSWNKWVWKKISVLLEKSVKNRCFYYSSNWFSTMHESPPIKSRNPDYTTPYSSIGHV